ncbi:MAG: S53 family peptidase [Kineosporiaceae bacterium]
MRTRLLVAGVGTAVVLAGAAVAVPVATRQTPGASPTAASGLTSTTHTAAPSQSPGASAPDVALAPHRVPGVPTPPGSAECLRRLGAACYSPAQLVRAYDLEPLWRAGDTGAGRTIAIVDSFGSPTIREDLHVFDATYGYPDPKLTIVQPAGLVPRFDPRNHDHTGWAGETTLDVEWAHALAPGADILLVETPVAETEGITGFPEIVTAETYVLDRDLADVISQSFSATEQTFTSPAQLKSQRSAFVKAAAAGVSVLAATGDDGAAGPDLRGRLLPKPVVGWPASDPLVTAIGGTKLTLDATGQRTSPDTTWHEPDGGASGGGLSTVFPRPPWQDGVQAVVGAARGIPDVSMSAAKDGGLLVYASYRAADRGWSVVGGTSAATPLFAAIVAIADQVAGHRLGLLNPRLYALAREPAARSGIVDVTTGDNVIPNVGGYPARRGYDLATGLGSVDANRFVHALAGR